MADWSDFPNGMIDVLADGDALLAQDVSDTTESPAGTTKGLLTSTLRAGVFSMLTTKGDIVAADASGTPLRLSPPRRQVRL